MTNNDIDDSSIDYSIEDLEWCLEKVKHDLCIGHYEEAHKKFNQFFPTNSDLSLARRVKEWIEENKKQTFYTEYLDKELQIETERDKTNRRQILKRLVANGVLKKERNARQYSIIEGKGSKMDWLHADDTPIDMVFPLGE